MEVAMQMDSRLLDDVARLIGGAMGTAQSARHEVEARLRRQLERVLGRMDLVSRDEFEAVRAIAIKARAEQEALAERVARLEARLGERGSSAPSVGA